MSAEFSTALAIAGMLIGCAVFGWAFGCILCWPSKEERRWKAENGRVQRQYRREGL